MVICFLSTTLSSESTYFMLPIIVYIWLQTHNCAMGVYDFLHFKKHFYHQNFKLSINESLFYMSW